MVALPPGGRVLRAAHRPSKRPTSATSKTYSNRSSGTSSSLGLETSKRILNPAAGACDSVTTTGTASMGLTTGAAPHPASPRIPARVRSVHEERRPGIRILYLRGEQTPEIP